MNKKWMHFYVALLLLCASIRVAGEVVIEDQGVSMSRAELEYIVSQWPPTMQQDAANDLTSRAELLNKALASKKLAREANALTPEKDGDAYWQKELMVRDVLRQFMVSRFMASIEAPDLTALAQERYATERDKYAWVPPARLSSHILLRCGDGANCDPKDLQGHAERMLAELRAGGDFEAMVLNYSEDPGSRLKKGRFDRWIEPGTRDVDRDYIEGLYAIEEIGDYSDVVVTKFGYHIIRLDEVREGYYLTYDQAKLKIMTALANEYGKLAVKTFDEGFLFTDDLRIEGDAMEEIFSKYKTPE